MFTHVYLCVINVYPVYLCLPKFIHLYSCLLLVTHAYTCLPMFTTVYLCLCMFTHVYPFLLMFTILFTLVNLCFLWSCTFEFDNLNNCDNFYYCVRDLLCSPCLPCLLSCINSIRNYGPIS